MVETPQASLSCSVPDDIQPGEQVMVCIRPENISLVTGDSQETTNVVEGKVETVAFLGEYLDCLVEVGNEQVRLHLHPGQEVSKGDRVRLHMPWESTCAVRLK